MLQEGILETVCCCKLATSSCQVLLPCKERYMSVLWFQHASSVLSAFSSFKLDEVMDCKRQKVDPAAVTPMETNDNIENSGSSPQKFFPKYLTNQKLLELQLSDSNFRRYVLLQFLILFQYLDSQVKFKSWVRNTSSVRNKCNSLVELIPCIIALSNRENFELTAEQTEWVKETTEKICVLISETPPDGPAFLQAVKHILRVILSQSHRLHFLPLDFHQNAALISFWWLTHSRFGEV